ncbi:Glycosyltransferase involved in cell wall bisynthesis [Clostridium frigidicarnis]|uniref:Glycosyltransferase involved in cell wall bisynthesis n=2 Tax=Clostridium frigidicarnis TaxID=84698 RepID=A0A1I0WJ13_9CLOT|nr:Glycosyltransferase involved in cell wall bisynthesis [Clostridium frigidicarnis]
MRYYMEYLKTGNVNLVKDMGMIPYKLHKNYGYDSTVVTYKNGDYPYLKNEVKGLKIDFIKKMFRSYSLDGARYLVKNGKNIDVLQIFHVTLSSVFYAYSYKMSNNKGKIYLKLDCSHKLPDKIKSMSKIGLFFTNKFFDKIDLMSAEQKCLHEQLKELLPKQRNKIIHVTNGVDFDYLNSKNIKYDFNIKENIILNVARIGAEEKKTDVLLEAFAQIPNIEKTNWKLRLIGPIEQKFEKHIERYFEKYPQIKGKVEFIGNIENREELYKEYRKAKIFTLTSDCESFGIAFIEAAALGDVIIATNVGIAKELVDYNNGKLVDINDINSLSKAFEEYINLNEEDFKAKSDKTYNICKEKFDWNTIIEKLNCDIKKIFN